MVAAYLAWAAWFAYIFWRLLKQRRVGAAFRYAIPVGVVGWGLAEMPPASWQRRRRGRGRLSQGADA